MTEIEADPSVKVVVFQSANPSFLLPISTYSKQLSAQRCSGSARLCAASVVHAGGEHRQDSRPHTRHW